MRKSGVRDEDGDVDGDGVGNSESVGRAIIKSVPDLKFALGFEMGLGKWEMCIKGARACAVFSPRDYRERERERERESGKCAGNPKRYL